MHRTCQSFVIYSAKCEERIRSRGSRRTFCCYLLLLWRSGSLFLFPQLGLLIATDSFCISDALGKRPASLWAKWKQSLGSLHFKIHKCITQKPKFCHCIYIYSDELSSVFCSDARGAEWAQRKRKRREKQTTSFEILLRLLRAAKKAPFHFSYHPNAREASSFKY